jgi:hypothetical protein
MGDPSVEKAVISPPIPRTFIDSTSALSYSAVRPGMNFRNSPTAPTIITPSASVDMTFLMLGAKRCSFVAIACASVSCSEDTTKGSSFTTVGLLP